MPVAVPVATMLVCPREKTRRLFIGVDDQVMYRCSGCEWFMSLSTASPTGTTNASRAAGAATIPVASGGASFTGGMLILIDTGTSSEVVTATATGSATSIPVTPFTLAHNSSVAIGQLAISPTYSGTGEDAVPAAPGWGF